MILGIELLGMAKLIDNRFVYMMLRTKNNEARIIVCQKLMNARKLEKRLHRQFKDSRFEMSPRIKYRKWWQNHVKIGIAKNPKRRREQVSKDIFRSGRTEWFALTDFELLFVKYVLH